MVMHHPGHDVRERSLGLGETAGGKRSGSGHEHILDRLVNLVKSRMRGRYGTRLNPKPPVHHKKKGGKGKKKGKNSSRKR